MQAHPEPSGPPRGRLRVRESPGDGQRSKIRMKVDDNGAGPVRGAVGTRPSGSGPGLVLFRDFVKAPSFREKREAADVRGRLP